MRGHLTLPHKRVTEFLAPLCLVAFFLFASSSVIGLTMRDDSYYLQNGPSIHLNDFLHFKDWSVLYSVWFRFLGIFCSNPIERYLLSWSVLVIVISLVPLAMKTPLAWLYTCILLIVPGFSVLPYVSLPAAALVLFGICLLLRRDYSLAASAAMAAMLCFILAFIRPEFTYGVYLSAVATLVATLFQAPRTGTARAFRFRLAGLTLGLAGAMFWIGLHAARSRSGLAFAQHYAWRAAELGLIPPGPNTWRSDYAVRRFGLDAAHNPNNGTASLGDFFRAKPRLFFGHLWHNLRDPFCWGLILLILAACLLPWFLRSLQKLRAPSLFLLLIGVPPLLGTVVIYPREHYAMILFPALVIYTLQFATVRPAQPNILWVLPCCGLIWVLNHNHIVGESDEALANRISLRQVQCTYAEDRLATADSHFVFSAVPLLPIYLPHPREIVTVDTLPNLAAFEQWAKQTHPAWISVDAGLVASYSTTSSHMEDFLHGQLGYTAVTCPAGAGLIVYQAALQAARQDALQAARPGPL